MMDSISSLFSVPVLLTKILVILIVIALLAKFSLGVRYIPHDRVGILEKLWSSRGSLAHGRILATLGEAGFQADVLRGGVHVGFPTWMYRVHTVPLVTIAEGRIGYVYARDGEPLGPSQTLGAIVSCNAFQDATGFLASGGQRGRQRLILREGVYAINTALFVVITETCVHAGPVDRRERERCGTWQQELAAVKISRPRIPGAAWC